MASALAYQGILSSVPFLLLIFLMLGKYIMSSNIVFLDFKKTVTLFLPYSQDIILQEVKNLYIAEGSWSIAGIVVCVWFIFPLVDTLRTLFCGVFKEKINRPFLVELAANVLSTFILMCLLMFLVIGEIVYIEIIKPLIKDINIPFDLIDITGNFVITLCGLVLFYYVFIPVKVHVKHILAGSTLTAFAWIVLRPSFALLMHINPQMGFIFGSLKAIFIVFFWVYLYFYVFIAGVEFTALLSKIRLITIECFLSGRTDVAAPAKFTVALNDGQILFDKAAMADCFYYIVSGSISLTVEGQPPVQKIAGDTFGVDEMLMNSLRAKKAVSTSDDTVVFPISQDDLNVLEKINPQVTLMILKQTLIPSCSQN